MPQLAVGVTRFRFVWVALVALCLPTVSSSFFPNVFDSHNDDTITNSGANAPSPSPTHHYGHSQHDSGSSNTQSSGGGSSRLGASAGNGIDFLVAAFFLIAAGWLVLALIYSVLVLIVVRLRARGQLDVYDDNFGRFYLLGTRCYIPFGCVLRRYVIAMNQERNNQGDPVTVRLMTREERRMAMEKLLDEQSGQKQEEQGADKTKTKEEDKDAVSNDESPEEIGHTNQSAVEINSQADGIADDDSEEEPVCTICLGEYEPTDECFTSSVCSHQFHRTCILEWLQRRANTECPCCRTPLVTDEQVWTTVQDMREERRRQIRKASRSGCCLCFRRDGHEQSMHQDDSTVDPTPPPSPAPTALTSFGSVDSPSASEDYSQHDAAVVENVESAQVSPDLEGGQRLHYE